MSELGPDPIDVEVGLRLRSLRRAKGMSQAALGDALGITFQQVQKYERGTNRISASMLFKAARAFGVQPGDFFPEMDAPRMPPQINHLATVRGAPELVDGYAAIISPRARRAVLTLVRSLREQPVNDEQAA